MSIPVTSIERRLVRHERWLSISLAWLSAAAASIYLGVIVTESGDPLERVWAAGWGNLALAIALLSLASQLILTVRAAPIEERMQADENLAVANRTLEATIRLLRQRNPSINYRAIITVYDPTTKTRTTLGGANFRIDPESTLTVPADWGVAGEAFVHNRCAYGDIQDEVRGRDESGAYVANVWNNVRSVVAFPLTAPDRRRPIGTVNFDADQFLAEAGLDQREMLDALSEVAEVVSGLLARRSAKRG
jgi:hypothetical protein